MLGFLELVPKFRKRIIGTTLVLPVLRLDSSWRHNAQIISTSSSSFRHHVTSFLDGGVLISAFLCAPSVFSVPAVVRLSHARLTTADTEGAEDTQSINQIRTLPNNPKALMSMKDRMAAAKRRNYVEDARRAGY